MRSKPRNSISWFSVLRSPSAGGWVVAFGVALTPHPAFTMAAMAVDEVPEETWTLERQLSRPGAVTSCAWSPDGMRLVSVGGGRVGV